jgi:hypothetical protein
MRQFWLQLKGCLAAVDRCNVSGDQDDFSLHEAILTFFTGLRY